MSNKKSGEAVTKNLMVTCAELARELAKKFDAAAAGRIEPGELAQWTTTTTQVLTAAAFHAPDER